MTNHYQTIHNLRMEIKRLRLHIVELNIEHDRAVKMLKNEIIRPRTDINTRPNDWHEVLRAICQVTDQTPDMIISKSRKRKPMFARHMFNHICRKRLGMTFMEIGTIVRCDHSTIISSVREFGDILSTDKEIQKQHAQVHTILHAVLE